MQKYQMTGIEEPTTEVQHRLMDYVDLEISVIMSYFLCVVSLTFGQ